MNEPVERMVVRIAELEQELVKYKAIVKQMAFNEEMNDAPKAPNATATRRIRKIALTQAANHVMDFGIPANSAALVELCKQIEALKASDALEYDIARDAKVAKKLNLLDPVFADPREFKWV